jgi:hypothetical protein
VYSKAAVSAGEEVKFNTSKIKKLECRVAGLLAINRARGGPAVVDGIRWLEAQPEKQSGVAAVLAGIEAEHAKGIAELIKKLTKILGTSK